MDQPAHDQIRGGIPSALGHLRVLDLAGPEAHYFGKLFADLGADVVKIESAAGDPARYMAPFAGDTPDPERSLYFINFNTNKKSVTLDITCEAGRELLLRLVTSADVLVESFTPGYLHELNLGFEILSKKNPALVTTSITPFGQSGPYKDFLGSELVTQAMGGLMYLQGDDNKPPCAAPCDQASQLACLHAAYGTLAALADRRKSGLGQHVDVSIQEIVAHLLSTIPNYAYSSEIARRTGVESNLPPGNYYRCKDGYVYLAIYLANHWRAMVEWMGTEALADPAWDDMNFRRSNSDIVGQSVAEFATGFSVSEFVEEGQRRHIAVTPSNTIEDLANSPQMTDREYFVTVEHPHVGNHSYPGPPYRFSETPWRIYRPAPTVGQHQEEVLGEPEKSPPLKLAKAQVRAKSGPPLTGVRILDFSRVWAGPLAARYLGDLGAEVIKIETSRYPEIGRTGRDMGPLWLTETSRGKLGVTVDFQQPRGLELVNHLVEVSDVVLENFAAGVMKRRGLGYDNFRRIKPDIIMVSMPGYGNTGPYSHYAAYGQSLMADVGLSHLWGYPDSPYEARPKVAYPDYVSAATPATAIMAALEYRAETGHGQYIEVAQAESLASTMGVALLDYMVNGRFLQPTGNRNPNTAPHGCYPCRGDDQWCVISCTDEEQWNNLCQAMESPSWTRDPMFGSLESRCDHQDELDEHISRWTADYTSYQVMRLLQKAAVPCGAVQSGEQLYQDYHLRARNFIVEVNHPGWGTLENTALTVGLSGSPGRITRAAPAVGQENYHVFSEMLGIGMDEVNRLIEDKVIS